MAYNLSLSNGEPLVTIADGTVDINFTSLNLIGKNFAGYGALMNQNFVYLLENFSNSAPPTNPLVGQLWYDADNRTMKVYTANDTWKVISSATASPTAPSNPVLGDQWWDTVNEQLKVWSGTNGWKLVGPLWAVSEGITGAIPATIRDTGTSPHIVIKFYVNDLVVGIWHKDVAFPVYPADQISGFPTTLQPGLTLSTTQGQTIHGTADNALALGGVAAANYLRGDVTSVQNVAGTLNMTNAEAIRLGGTINVVANNAYNIGSTNYRLNTVYATTFNGVATSAQYADLAERFEADAEYEPGTVVSLGGEKEVTQVEEELCEEVFGVISTAPAHLMNAGAGTDATHPPIAVSGRVPVKVTGRVRKGQRLVSAGQGMARAANKNEITPWNVIGRALENKTTDGVGTVEAIVKVSA